MLFWEGKGRSAGADDDAERVATGAGGSVFHVALLHDEGDVRAGDAGCVCAAAGASGSCVSTGSSEANSSACSSADACTTTSEGNSRNTTPAGNNLSETKSADTTTGEADWL